MKTNLKINLSQFAQLRKIKNFLGWALKERCAYCLLILGLLLLFLAGLIFYLYVWPDDKLSGSDSTARLKINTALYEKIVKNIEQKKQRLEEELNKTYPDFFR